MPSQPFINSLALLVFGAALTWMATRYWFQRNMAVDLVKQTEAKAKLIADDHRRVVERLQELEGKLALVNQAIIPISTAFQAILIKELTHFHTPELDGLMEKIGPPNTLTAEEYHRMEVLLEERTRDMGPLISESERDAAKILPILIKRSKAEMDQVETAESLKVKLVSVTALVGIPNHREELADGLTIDRRAMNRRAVDKLVADLLQEGATTERQAVQAAHEAQLQEDNVDVLHKIEQHTATSAAALTNLNEQTSAKLAREILKKTPKDPEPDA